MRVVAEHDYATLAESLITLRAERDALRARAEKAEAELKSERETESFTIYTLRAERDALHAKVAALIAHMNQVHEELGGTDTVLTLQAAQYVVAERDALRTVATGWCAECKGMGLITVHTKDSANSGNVTTRRCVCGGEPLFTTRGGAAVSDPTTVPFSFYAKLTQDYERSLRAEIHELRTVYQAAAVYCGDRTVANEHALIDAVGDAKALAVQP